MSKKIIIPIVVVFVLALVGGGAALAASYQPLQASLGNLAAQAAIRVGGNPITGYGQITAVGDNQFTVKNQSGEHVVLVDAKTEYLAPNGDKMAFSDLKVGNWVIGQVTMGSGNQATATRVILLPAGFDPKQITAKAAGKVTAVNASGNTFTVQDKKGKSWTVAVDANTIFLGGVKSFADLKTGMEARVGGKSGANGDVQALIVFASFPTERHIGLITAVNASANSFTLHARDGKDYTYTIDANTKFHSRNNAIKSISDLKTGMMAIVSVENANGTLVVKNILAGSASDLDLFGLRASGKIVSITNNSMVLQTAAGKQVTVQLTDKTTYMSWFGQAKGLSDLKPGMRVYVGGQQLSDGSYQATLILMANQPAK